MDGQERMTDPKYNDLIPKHRYELTKEEAENELIKKDNKFDSLGVGEHIEIEGGLKVEKLQRGGYILWNRDGMGVPLDQEELQSIRKLWED